MKKLTDEILNKYIDGELTSGELNSLKNFIEENPGELEKLKAHEQVENILRNLEADKAPDSINSYIMKKISPAKTKTAKDFYFFYTLIIIFITSILGVVFYSLSLSENKQLTDKIIGTFEVKQDLTFLSSVLDSAAVIISNKTVFIAGSALTVILFVLAYFIFESHRQFKRSFQNLSR